MRCVGGVKCFFVGEGAASLAVCKERPALWIQATVICCATESDSVESQLLQRMQLATI